MSAARALYLGLDASTQSLSAVVIEVSGDQWRVILETSLNFDEALPQYGTKHGVIPSSEPTVALSSPLMWAEALDLMMDRLVRSGLDLSRLAAVSGSAQQHGSVYLKSEAAARLSALDATRPLVEQVAPMLSRAASPIWMDSSTSAQCAEIAAAVGGNDVLAQRTGSRAFERFTGPQIRRFFQTDPAAYASTRRVHLVSSFLSSLLLGADSPIDPGDGSGMNLMDLSTRTWWGPAVEATAPALGEKLPPVVAPWTVAGTLAPYWRVRFGLPPAKTIVWSGDNPSSLVGVGLVREGRVAISLGTSDTVFGLMNEPRVSVDGTGHVFGAPTGSYMGLTCFSNGSLARERMRGAYGLSWPEFSRALEATTPGNGGQILVPWFDPEITPVVPRPGVHRCGSLSIADGAANVRAVVEGQMMAMLLHSRWMGVRIDTIHATGGASVNTHILQVMADVFGADVFRFDGGNSAALGAALRALHADRRTTGEPLSWDEVARGFGEPDAGRLVTPDPGRHGVYRDLLPLYQECEASALLARGQTP